VEGLRRYASDTGLEYRYAGALEGPWSILRWGSSRRVDGIAGGTLPDGRPAVIAGLVITATSAEGTSALYPHLIATTDVPEAGESLGWVEVRSREANQFGQLPPGARFPTELTDEVPLESAFFAQRFELAIGPGTDPNAVVQLFSPAFVHWYAYEAPYAMSAELLGGRLCLHAPSGLRSHDRARSIWQACGRTAEALAREGLEDSGAA
jgi:hypothetical protein